MERFFFEIVVRNLLSLLPLLLFPEWSFSSSKLVVGDDGAVEDLEKVSLLLSKELKDCVRIGSIILCVWRGEFDSEEDIDKNEAFEGDDKPCGYANWFVSKSKCSVNLDIMMVIKKCSKKKA